MEIDTAAPPRLCGFLNDDVDPDAELDLRNSPAVTSSMLPRRQDEAGGAPTPLRQLFARIIAVIWPPAVPAP